MSVLLFQLVGPMQSWGVQSRFSIRDTGREPTKSGVIGLLCAALGRARHEKLDDLSALTMGVRVDREGSLDKDYHTALQVAKAGGGIKDCEPSTRYFLSDAAFLVGLQGDLELLQHLDRSLRTPVWPLSLGRKSFLPSLPIPLPLDDQAIYDEPLERVLLSFRPIDERVDRRFRLALETSFGKGEPVMDQPVSFATRTFHVRYVQHRVESRMRKEK